MLIINGSDENDTIHGTEDNDTVYGRDGDDILYGNEGDDSLHGGFGQDVLKGVDGDDSLNGSHGNDTVIGGSGDDFLYGHLQDDLLDGESGNDTIDGGLGDDTLIGGEGNDKLVGGPRDDVFRFYTPSEGVDQITDFTLEEDIIQINDYGFGGGLTSGILDLSQFTIGAGAADASDRLIYNDLNGDLFFDVDGTGAVRQVQIASLDSGLNPTSDNFVVF